MSAAYRYLPPGGPQCRLVEATEEAIINPLTKSQTLEGREGRIAEALPLDQVIKILKRYKIVK